MTNKKLYFLIALLLSLHFLSFKVFACGERDMWHGTNLSCRHMMRIDPNKYSEETIQINNIPWNHNYHCSFTFHSTGDLTDAGAYFKSFQPKNVTYKVTRGSGAYKNFTMRNFSGKKGSLFVTIGRDKPRLRDDRTDLSIFIVCNEHN